MSRNLDTNLAAALSSGLITPVLLASFNFRSGLTNVWSGVGPFTWNGLTFQGVGNFGKISAITEGTEVQADGITVQLAGVPFIDAGGPLSAIPSNVVAPVTVPAGQAVAWALPTENSTPFGSFSTGFLGGYAGTALSSNSGGYLAVTGSGAEGPQGVACLWQGFQLPELPSDAVIQAIYPVIVSNGYVDLMIHDLTGGVGTAPTQLQAGNGIPASGPYSGQFSAASIGNTAADVTSAWVWFNEYNSLDQTGLTDWDDVTFVGLAIYYTSSQAASLLQASFADIQQGAPASLWFGLMSGGALIGTPYLIFSGIVDQPTIEIDTQALTFTLALENKLANLVRATCRRYTAADQRLYYPDDIGFNWVEILNDVALRWGT